MILITSAEASLHNSTQQVAEDLVLRDSTRGYQAGKDTQQEWKAEL